MKPYDLYNHQINLPYRKNAADYNWFVEVNDKEKTIYLFTQYSASWLDWLVNFLFFVIPQVKRWFVYFTPIGWQSAFNSCKELFMAEAMYQYNRHPDYNIVCCGHSYGGAGSVLVGIEWFFRTGVKSDLITFGSPKTMFLILSKLICRMFFNSCTEYCHKSDICTYMPPLPSYWHVHRVALGKFTLKGLFDPFTSHLSYGNPDLYK